MIREALGAEERFLVAVGGDRLVHEIVNGVFEINHDATPVLGIVPIGADNEFFRQFGLPLDPERACAHLAGDAVYPIDIGRVRCVGETGREHSRYFANIAEAGLGARMAQRAARSGRRAARFLGFWSALVRTRPATVHVEAARKAYDGPAWQVVVGNGRFGTGGFRVSPRSFPGDGVLEVLIHHGPRSQAFVSLPRASRGEQVPSPHITELRGSSVRIESDPPLPLAVDGIPIGWTPASIDVLPQALLLKI